MDPNENKRDDGTKGNQEGAKPSPPRGFGKTKADRTKEMSDIIRENQKLEQEGEEYYKKRIGQVAHKKAKALDTSSETDDLRDIPLDGDIYMGSVVFMRHCASCHALSSGSTGTTAVQGPSLGLIFGRKIGVEQNFSYSDAMLTSRITWNNKNMWRFFKDPQSFIPTNRCRIPAAEMTDEDRSDLLKFLKSFTKHLKRNNELQARKTYGDDFVTQSKSYQNEFNAKKKSRFTEN